MMDLLEEAVVQGVPVELAPPVINCKALEDNSGVLQLTRLPKMRPRTRHIAVKYKYFREVVAKGRITIQHVYTDKQLADVMTKNLARDPCLQLRKGIMGW
jgi:hypothetical protein